MYGTIKEISERQNVQERTIMFYLTDAYKRRIKARNSKNYIEVFRLGGKNE